jgi:hypothetical protein
MKLDRTTKTGGKYAVVNLRKLRGLPNGKREAAVSAIETLKRLGVLSFGKPGEIDEFFVLMLKDVHASYALTAYADSVNYKDKEFASDIYDLAKRSGVDHPACKNPD